MGKHIVVPRAPILSSICDKNLELKALPRIWIVCDPSFDVNCVSLT
jgi:hypothetical protein